MLVLLAARGRRRGPYRDFYLQKCVHAGLGTDTTKVRLLISADDIKGDDEDDEAGLTRKAGEWDLMQVQDTRARLESPV